MGNPLWCKYQLNDIAKQRDINVKNETIFFLVLIEEKKVRDQSISI